MGSNLGNPEFLLQAQRLLACGRVDQAAEKLALFRDDCFKVPVLPREYYRLRAIVELLHGNVNEAEASIRHSGSISYEFLTEYERAFTAYAERLEASKLSRWSFGSARRARRNHDKLVEATSLLIKLAAREIRAHSDQITE